MSNFFKFEKDIDIEENPIDQSTPLKFHAYGGTSWFNISGYAYPNSATGDPTIFEIKNAFVLPSGKYEISINKELKNFDQTRDKLYFRIGDLYEEIEKEPKIITIEKQGALDFVFMLESSVRYFVGDNYKKQEDFGKDYSIQINIISGGLYEREKKYAVLKGDLNEDGMITLQDLARMRAYILGAEYMNETDLFRYDINGDGFVDIADLTSLALYLTGQEKIYDIEFRDEVEH